MAERVDESGERGIDRRALIKKAAIGGAAVWVAPTLISSAAHAQGSSDAGTLIGRFMGSGANVDLITQDGGQVRAVGDYLASQTADGDGTVVFSVLGGKHYLLYSSLCGLLGPVLVPVGGTAEIVCD